MKTMTILKLCLRQSHKSAHFKGAHFREGEVSDSITLHWSLKEVCLLLILIQYYVNTGRSGLFIELLPWTRAKICILERSLINHYGEAKRNGSADICAFGSCRWWRGSKVRQEIYFKLILIRSWALTMCRRYHHFATCSASTNEENFECDEVA